MPSLRHLLEELGKLFGNPDDVRIKGETFDNIVGDIKEEAASGDGEENDD